VEICYHIKTSEIRLRRFSVELRDSVIVICSYDPQKVNKTNHPIQTPSIVTNTRDIISELRI
jgi:hypothetical protein